MQTNGGEKIWNVRELDQIFKTLNAEKQRASEASLLATKNKEDEILDAKISIIRYIVETKQLEAKEKEKEKEKKEQKQKIMTVLERKENQQMEEKSVEELKAMLANL